MNKGSGDYMTKEEALRRVEGYLTDDFVTEDFDELEDIMKALRQEPREDAVSRKAVDQNIYDYAESNGLSYANMKNYILDVPLVTSTQKWIPCSERLPKESGDYLVSTSFDIGAEEPVREVYKDFFSLLSQKWLYHDEDVIAWQSLPPSYQGE